MRANRAIGANRIVFFGHSRTSVGASLSQRGGGVVVPASVVIDRPLPTVRACKKGAIFLCFRITDRALRHKNSSSSRLSKREDTAARALRLFCIGRRSNDSRHKRIKDDEPKRPAPLHPPAASVQLNERQQLPSPLFACGLVFVFFGPRPDDDPLIALQLQTLIPKRPVFAFRVILLFL